MATYNLDKKIKKIYSLWTFGLGRTYLNNIIWKNQFIDKNIPGP